MILILSSLAVPSSGSLTVCTTRSVTMSLTTPIVFHRSSLSQCVGNAHGEGIAKDQTGKLEADAMFGRVRAVFLFVPSERHQYILLCIYTVLSFDSIYTLVMYGKWILGLGGPAFGSPRLGLPHPSRFSKGRGSLIRGTAGELHRSLRQAQGRLFVGSRPLCVRLRFLRMTIGQWVPQRPEPGWFFWRLLRHGLSLALPRPSQEQRQRHRTGVSDPYGQSQDQDQKQRAGAPALHGQSQWRAGAR